MWNASVRYPKVNEHLDAYAADRRACTRVCNSTSSKLTQLWKKSFSSLLKDSKLNKWFYVSKIKSDKGIFNKFSTSRYRLFLNYYYYLSMKTICWYATICCKVTGFKLTSLWLVELIHLLIIIFLYNTYKSHLTVVTLLEFLLKKKLWITKYD